MRSRVANLKDVKNPSLRENVLRGLIPPDRIARMTAEVSLYMRFCSKIFFNLVSIYFYDPQLLLEGHIAFGLSVCVCASVNF